MVKNQEVMDKLEKIEKSQLNSSFAIVLALAFALCVTALNFYNTSKDPFDLYFDIVVFIFIIAIFLIFLISKIRNLIKSID